VDQDGTVKILDMGLARIDDGMAAPGRAHSIGPGDGTVDYMAPEQPSTRAMPTRGRHLQLGCTLYRLLTGQNMYEGESLVQKLMAHQSKPIRRWPHSGPILRSL